MVIPLSRIYWEFATRPLLALLLISCGLALAWILGRRSTRQRWVRPATTSLALSPSSLPTGLPSQYCQRLAEILVTQRWTNSSSPELSQTSQDYLTDHFLTS